jgi:hypothetical protein
MDTTCEEVRGRNGLWAGSDPAFEETIVALLRDISFETRMRQLRSSGRLNSRVAVAVEWGDGDRTLRAEGYTVDIAPKTCMAVVPQGFAVGQRLHLSTLGINLL